MVENEYDEEIIVPAIQSEDNFHCKLCEFSTNTVEYFKKHLDEKHESDEEIIDEVYDDDETNLKRIRMKFIKSSFGNFPHMNMNNIERRVVRFVLETTTILRLDLNQTLSLSTDMRTYKHTFIYLSFYLYISISIFLSLSFSRFYI